jgi:putative sigma-54 modulation protein
MRQHRPRKHTVRHVEEKVLRWDWLVQVDQAPNQSNGAEIEVDSDVDNPENSVVHTEKYPVKPMFIDEAVLQMEMSPKQFLVFLNAKTEKVNVIYRRKSGDFGLIEPTFN